MKTWTSRFILFVFFVNCLQPGAWAEPSFAAKNRKSLGQRLEEKATLTEEQAYKAAQAELQKVLQEPDLSATEKQFAQLEMQIIDTELERLEKLNSIDDLDKYYNANKIYTDRVNVLKARENDLERQEALRLFYQEATQDESVAQAVFALHRNAAYMATKELKEDSKFTMQKAFTPSGQLPSYATMDPAALKANLQANPKQENAKFPVASELKLTPDWKFDSPVTKLWEENKISPEELVEYADPIVVSPKDQPTTGAIADAASVLFSLFYVYNLRASEMDKPTLQNVAWMARRLKYRAAHQLHVLQQKAQNNSVAFVQARGNLMLLLMQAETFLKTHGNVLTEKDDTQLPQYDTLRDELKAYQPGVFSYEDVGRAISNEVKQAYEKQPDQTLVLNNLAYAVRFALFTDNMESLVDFIAMVNQDGRKFHGGHEQGVNTVFGSIINTMVNDYVPQHAQKSLENLLTCTAAPKCKYYGSVKRNAVNVRIQSVAVASMLRQITSSGKTTTDKGEENVATASLNKNLFNSANFRKELAAYTVDLYWPLVRWHAPTNATMDQSSYLTDTYGLNGDEIKDLSNHLAVIFESFLPLMEPKMIFVDMPDNHIDYAGCKKRVLDPKQKMFEMKRLPPAPKDKLTAYSRSGKRCPDGDNYGPFSNAVVLDSAQNMRGMTTQHLEIKELMVENFIKDFGKESITWYMWSAGFRALGYLWKGLRVTALAGRTALRAQEGIKLARFQSKFAQAWKYSTRAIEKETGIVELSKKGKQIYVEIHHPGYQGYGMMFDKAVLEGHSLKSLKGRILLRRAVHREVTEQFGHASPFARSLTKAQQQAVYQVEKPVVDAAKKVVNKATKSGQEPTFFTPYTSKEAAMQDLWVDPITGKLEQIQLKPLTGNLMGELSGKYVGTAPAFAQGPSPLAYNIAKGMMDGGALPFNASGKLLYNMYPELGKIWSNVKFVTKLTLADQFADSYMKSYMEDFAKKQEKTLSALTGLKPDAGNAEPAAKTVLDQIQGLQSVHESTAGKAMMAGMFIFNEWTDKALKTLGISNPIQPWRKHLFKFTTDLTNNSFTAKLLASMGLEEVLPDPLSIATVYAMLASDVRPDIADPNAIAQYASAARDQKVNTAVEKRPIHEFTDAIDEALKSLDQDVNAVIKMMQPFNIKPNARKEIKRIYRVYDQELKRAKLVAQTDLDKADEQLKKSGEKLRNTQNVVVREVIAQSIQEQKQNALKTTSDSFKENYFDWFTQDDEKELAAMTIHFYDRYEKALIKFHTVDPQPQSADQLQNVQNAANQEIGRASDEFVASRDALEGKILNRIMRLKQYKVQYQADYENSLSKDAPETFESSLFIVYHDFYNKLVNAILKDLSDEELEKTYQALVAQREARWETIKQGLISLNPANAKWFKPNTQSNSLSEQTDTSTNEEIILYQ